MIYADEFYHSWSLHNLVVAHATGLTQGLKAFGGAVSLPQLMSSTLGKAEVMARISFSARSSSSARKGGEAKSRASNSCMEKYG